MKDPILTFTESGSFYRVVVWGGGDWFCRTFHVTTQKLVRHEKVLRRELVVTRDWVDYESATPFFSGFCSLRWFDVLVEATEFAHRRWLSLVPPVSGSIYDYPDMLTVR